MNTTAELFAEHIERVMDALPRVGDPLVWGVNDPGAVATRLAELECEFLVALTRSRWLGPAD